MADGLGNLAEKNLRIATLNVDGIRGKKKREAIIRTLKNKCLDIVALQETHLLRDDIAELSKTWGGKIIHKEGTVFSKGICLMFNNKFDDSNIIEIFKDDRIIICAIKVFENIIPIACIYGPREYNEKKTFYKTIKNIVLNKLNQSEIENIILLGDFNVVMNNSQDIISGQPHCQTLVEGLNKSIAEMGLHDCWREHNPEERAFTWRRRSPPIARRLDYIFTGHHIHTYTKNCIIQSLGYSDHRAVITQIQFNDFKRGNGIFKMNVSELKNEVFVNKLINIINQTKIDSQNLNLDPKTTWCWIKIKVREAAQAQGKKRTKIRKNVEHLLYKRLNDLENNLTYDINNTTLTKEIEDTKKKLEIMEIENTKAAQIRSTIKWIQDGEKSTQFFLNLEKQNSKNNTIYNITNENNDNITDEKEIVQEIANYYEKLYSDENFDKENSLKSFEEFSSNVKLETLNEEQKQFLERHISEKELLDSLKSMAKGKSPGIDGLPVEFYLATWEHIKTPLLEYYNYALQEGSLADSTQTGVIALLYKGKQLPRDKLENWRPITLTCCDYKIISKLLSRRMKTVMGNIIGQYQQGFLGGRNINKTIREIDDMLEYDRQKKRNNILLAVDFKQAFDRLNCDYILKVFELYNFGEYFRNWMVVIFNNRSSLAKNGGHISQTFPVKSGVRQGCALSSLIFILATNLLAEKIIQEKKIKGIEYPNDRGNLKIRMFADDCTLFGRDIIDIREILAKIKEFAKFSGLIINKNKCNIMFTNNINIEQVEEEIDIKVVKQTKILGTIFSNTKEAGDVNENWKERIEKLKKTLTLWSRRDLTIIGRIQIIKTFGISLFLHLMQSIALPNSAIEEITQIFYKFLWAKKFTDEKFKDKIKRNVINSSKEIGGLNMINIQNFQTSCFLAWGEKLIEERQKIWSVIPNFFLGDVGGTTALESTVQSDDFKGLLLVKSNFWKKVLTAWLDNNNENTEPKLNYEHEVLFNNRYITVSNKVLFIPQCIKNNILSPKDAGG